MGTTETFSESQVVQPQDDGNLRESQKRVVLGLLSRHQEAGYWAVLYKWILLPVQYGGPSINGYCYVACGARMDQVTHAGEGFMIVKHVMQAIIYVIC